MPQTFPVNEITEEVIRTAHAEGRLHISLNAALAALKSGSHTQLYGCIEATQEEKDRAVRYSPQEIVDILRYIQKLKSKLPEDLQRETKDERLIVSRIPFVLRENPQLAKFQHNYGGIFVSAMRFMCDPDAMDRLVQRVQLISSMQIQGYNGVEAAKTLNKMS